MSKCLWDGIKCEICDTRCGEEKTGLGTIHETLSGQKLFKCYECNKKESEAWKQELIDAGKRPKPPI